MPRRVLHDKFFKQAKADGYVARSAYKLLELQQRERLIRPGDLVVDLGCAPGSWMQVAAELCGGGRRGGRGFVVGVDLKPIDAEVERGLRGRAAAAVMDAAELDPGRLAELAGLEPPALADAVVSDMAPNTSGHGDHFRSVHLCRVVLERCRVLLRPGGSLAMKVFEGEELAELRRETGALFGRVRVTKPAASRDVSRETYVVGLGFRPAGDAMGSASRAAAENRGAGGRP